MHHAFRAREKVGEWREYFAARERRRRESPFIALDPIDPTGAQDLTKDAHLSHTHVRWWYVALARVDAHLSSSLTQAGDRWHCSEYARAK